MNKDEARELLNDFLLDSNSYQLPIHEVIIKRIELKSKIEDLDLSWNDNNPYHIVEYSFRELIKTAYNLKDNE